jgi:type VI secretion system protein ImpL
MWLWIFGILVILAVWVIWLLFPPAEAGASEIMPLWLAVTISVVILGLLIGLWLVRRIRAARAARALENAIKQQAQEQAINAKPEDREEIQALYRQIAEGINALKTSKLAGGRRGEHALYALPWYAIVGPPGAGKTTALRHSGLSFPFLDPNGGGVRGVGGTRNCDWWFTNEAILLDTAGRYTTESDDRDEWVAFLEQLMKYRPEKPLNGVLVAISVSELLDATDDQIKQLAGKVRARVDEMQTTLKMTMPVYVVFTKADLVAGFVEYFGDLKKSERGQPWGATYRLEDGKGDSGKMFEREFDILVEKLHGRVTKRINTERSRTNRERIYQFPLEFAAIKKPLADFMAEAFAPGRGSGPDPILRGFYFTSGTQEGKPLDRVVGAMGRAFGLKGSVVEESEGSKEAKSYFLKDVFEKIVFPDQEIASLSQTEVRRRLLQRLAIAAAAVFVAMLFIVPGLISYLNNRELVLDSERISTAAGQVNWSDGSSSVKKVQKLDELRSQIEKLKDWRDNGKPIAYSWFMYQGNTLLDSLIKQYNATLTEGFLKPSKAKLEEKVGAVQGKEYLKDYNNLKTYLLLGEPERLAKDPELERWHAARLTQVWSEVLLPQSELPEPDLKAKVFPHVQLYVQLMRDGDIKPIERDTKLVEAAREKLRTADQATAYYELFVLPRNEEKIDETGPDSPDNLKFPPITLSVVFADRPEITGKLGVLDSMKYLAEGRYGEVKGAFTTEAFKVVDKLLAEEGVKLLEREKWVVPYDRDEKKQGERVQTALKRARQRYENNYISEWEEFFRDIDVKIPENNAESIKEFRLLATPDWAYKRLLETLSDNVPCPVQSAASASLMRDGGVLDQIKQRAQRRIEAQSNIQLEELKAEKDMTSRERLCQHFKPMIVFGVDQPYVPPPAPADGSPAPPAKLPPEPQLNKYIGHLESLASEMQVVEEGPLNTETKNATELFTKAVKESEQMLLQLDKTGQTLLTPLLMNPLRQGYEAFIKGAGGAASGLWEVMVWPDYRDKIKDRYPFNLAARRDASYEDMVAFFAPKGTLWGFYDTYLANFHMKQKHDFIPMAHLQGYTPKGKPFTPFKSAMYPCLKRASEITDALWPGFKGEAPGVVFQVNLKTVSPIVSDVIFEVDGQTKHYRNEKEFWHEFKWPGEERKGARIQVRGAGGLDEEIVRDGPWGIFRLLESADKLTAEKDDDQMFVATWTMSAPPVSVTLQVKPRRGNHPFPMSFFRGTNCPPSIGDKFGPGGEKK